MKISILKCFFICGISLYSCKGPSIFIPALVGNDMSYIPKALSSDSIHRKHSFSANYSVSSMNGGSAGNGIEMGSFQYSFAKTYSHINWAIGTAAFLGKTESLPRTDKTIDFPEFYNKPVKGLTLRTSFGVHDSGERADFRILSWENALSFEGGQYASFRENLSRQTDLSNTILHSGRNTWTTGGATEYSWRAKNNATAHFGLRFFFGYVINWKKNTFYAPLMEREFIERRKLAMDFTFYAKLNRFYGTYTSGSFFGASFAKVGLGYAF